MPYHRSHENGRDADLIFYAVDAAGTPLGPPEAMPRYDRRLRSHPPRDPVSTPISARTFDLTRNWALVAALLDDPSIDVEYLFISERLRERLLDYARATSVPAALLEKARVALRQPHGGHALPHDDHLHLRIKCSASDRAQGCVDEGAVRLRVERVRPSLS
jgi:penicillin-insensitive murein endopeptidase